MEKCVVNIKEVYRDKLLPPHSVQLELVVKSEGEHFLSEAKHIPIGYENLLTSKKGTVKRVLVEGGAGTGKTTLCVSFSKGWANGDLFQEYDLLLLLPLHEERVASVSSLSELIDFLKVNVNSQVIASCFQQNNGRGVLLVADGWNELHESKRLEGLFLHNLLFGDTLSLASIIVTSRPSASAPLHQSSFVDRFIEIRGFNEKSIKQYIQSKFSNDRQIADNVLEQLDHNPLVQSICTNPLSCTGICHLNHTCDVFPSTMTDLCTKIILKILCHNLGKTDTHTSVSSLPEIDALPEYVRDSWWRLCKLAFQSIEKSRVDLSQFQSFQYGIEVIGLVEYIPEGNGMSLHFLHPCYHEYLAALHLVRQPAINQLQGLETIKFRQSWKYFFGLCSQQDHKSILKHAIQTLSKDDHSKCLLCQCAFEANTPDVTAEVIKSLGTQGSSNTLIHFGDPSNAHDCDAILYIIASMQGSECDRMVINFKACSLNAKQITKLTDILSTKSGKLQVKDLDLSDNNLPDESVADLFNRAKDSFHFLEKLFVCKNNIKEEGIRAIMYALSSKKAIQLDLSFNCLTKAGLKVLQNAIECGNLISIEILFMQESLTKDSSYNMEYLTTFAEALLTHCPRLRRLDLSGNDFGEPESPTISRICSQLGKLNLRLNSEYMSEVDNSFITIMEDSIKPTEERKVTIDYTVVHGVFVGPGRSGKDSLMKRLMGEGPLHPEAISPSTGVLEDVCKVEVKKLCTVAAAVNNLLWRKLDYDEEALEIMMSTVNHHTATDSCHTASDTGRTASDTCHTASDTCHMANDSTTKEKKETVSSAIILCENTSIDHLPTSSEMIEVAKGSVMQMSSSDSVARETMETTVDSIESPLDIFKRAVKLRRMDALREHLESSWSLYLTNTGGQSDFQELLPLLVCGPSVFFVTFPLNKSLHKHYTVQYQYPEGNLKTYHSPSTLMNEIFQTLATIDALDCTGPCSDVKLKPMVFFIGTHKDKIMLPLSDLIQKNLLPESCINDAIQMHKDKIMLPLSDLTKKYLLPESCINDAIQTHKDTIMLQLSDLIQTDQLPESCINDAIQMHEDKIMLPVSDLIQKDLLPESCINDAIQEHKDKIMLPLSDLIQKDLLPEYCINDTIQTIDEQLREKVEQTALFKQGSIELAVDTKKMKTLMFAVNNLDKDDTDFQKIRLALQKAVERCEEFTITCPSTWLIFSLILRAKHKSNQVLSYNDCFKIAQNCGILDRADLNDALFFIHTRLGLVRYFCVKELNKLVVIDPQILFNTITKLIVNTFVSDHAKSNEIKDFEKRGIFSMDVIKRISEKSEFQSSLSFQWLLDLLNHLRIAAFYTIGKPPDQETFCFFPSVLCHALIMNSITSCCMQPPLLIAFKSGFCPRGIPGALIVYLMSNKKWKLRSKKVFKNQVSFSVGSCNIILKILPTHLQISFDPNSAGLSDQTKVKRICQEVYTQFQQAMKTIIKGYRECKYYFAFYCTNSDCKDPHPAKILWDEEMLQCELQDEQTHLPTDFESWKPPKGNSAKQGISMYYRLFKIGLLSCYKYTPG